MFGEWLGDEFEGATEAGENGAKSHKLGLWLPSLTLLVARSSEETGYLRRVGQIDIGAVDGEDPEGAFPKQGGSELRFEATHQMFPKRPPEPDGELLSSLAERLLGDAGS